MSVIYSVKCSICGTEVKLEDVELDSTHDLIVTVEPCRTCISTARDEGHENGFNEAAGR